ncbi:hypothetical protein GCM10009560_01490 [Nonomuraea longicatena]|uniref:Uncharacterized protein n=1 Tax=Nonomuraea longicatena TaxID=83682 RepID=A0ABP3Z2H5_9ACTN
MAPLAQLGRELAGVHPRGQPDRADPVGLGDRLGPAGGGRHRATVDEQLTWPDECSRSGFHIHGPLPFHDLGLTMCHIGNIAEANWYGPPLVPDDDRR